MSPSTTPPERGARVFPIPPPLYYAAGFATGTLAHRAVPLPIGGRPATAVVGGIAVAAGAGLANVAFTEVIRHHSTVVPHHPVSTLITTGVYGYTRNPMYTGLALAYVGGALLAGSWWPLLILPAVLRSVRRLVIDPEERYLADRFGRTYNDYRARVPRWLPIRRQRTGALPTLPDNRG
jgi:protein-S-isoprenylcysteine O-methyltransferase Ste14